MSHDFALIVEKLLAEHGPWRLPCDVLELAERAGLTTYPGNRLDGVRIIGDSVIYYDERLPASVQREDIAFAFGQWVLAWAGAEITEDGARYIAGALLFGMDEVAADLVPAPHSAVRHRRSR